MIQDVLVIEGKPETWEQALHMTYSALHAAGYVKDTFYDACVAREKEYPTGLPTEINVAIPHTDAVHVNIPAICMLRLLQPVKFKNMGDPDEEVDAEFVFNMALQHNHDQLPLIQAIIKVAQDAEYLSSLKTKPLAQIREELLKRWIEETKDQPKKED